MKNPFSVLQVEETASDEDIRQAYLRGVREFPPDRDSERFQEIRAAYETIKTRRDRLRYQLFHSEPPSVDNLLSAWLDTGHSGRPTEEQLRQVIALSLYPEQQS